MNWLLLLFLLVLVDGVKFELPSTTERCVSDELKKDQLGTGEYDVASDNDQVSVDVLVTDPNGEEVFSKKKTKNGKFGFTACCAGEYRICFKNNDMIAHDVSVKFRSGIEAKDLSEIVQKQHLQPLSAEILRIEETIKNIRHELLLLKKREAEMRDMNETINSRVTWFSLFSVGVVSSLGVWQILHLKAYFMEKKLI